VSEGSIGSNLRRIEAVTGAGALERVHGEELRLRAAAALLNVGQAEVPERIERLLEQVRGLNEEVTALRARGAAAEAQELAAAAVDRIVVLRRDGLSNEDLARLATATRDSLGSGVVVLAGAGPEGQKAGIAVMVSSDLVAEGASAAEIALPAAKALGGGTQKNPERAVGGGPRVEAVDEALELARAGAERAVGSAR
jgi:alanyl-tRNA synthetase